MDQICENWLAVLVNPVCFGLLLHGKSTQINLVFLRDVLHVLSLYFTKHISKEKFSERKKFIMIGKELLPFLWHQNSS